MVLFRVQVDIPMDSGLTADYATNTFHFNMDDDEPTAELVADALDDFYGELAAQLSSLITPATWTYKFFRLTDSPPRVPIYFLTGRGPATTGSNSSPPEVALCLSWRTEYVSGFPNSRLRNRVYIGPLHAGAIGNDGRPSSSTMTAMIAAGQSLFDASGSAGWTWVVYSPTEAQSFEITQGWCDNEFDTQRRRGRQATSRSTFGP